MSVSNGPNGPTQTVRSDYMAELELMRARAEGYEIESAEEGKIRDALVAINTEAKLIELQAKLAGPPQKMVMNNLSL